MILKYLLTYSNRSIRNTLLTGFLVFASLSVVFGQQQKEAAPPLRERLFYGGNFGLQFGTITDIQVSPVIGVWLLPRLAVAAGPDYRFYKYQSDRTNIYGLKTYMEFVVVKDLGSVLPVGSNTGIFLHIEDELLNLESSYWKNPPVFSKRFYINTILAGGGLSQQLGRRSSMNMMILWALNDSGYGVYSYPEIRISFTF
jgi:hypothetical protein